MNRINATFLHITIEETRQSWQESLYYFSQRYINLLIISLKFHSKDVSYGTGRWLRSLSFSSMAFVGQSLKWGAINFMCMCMANYHLGYWSEKENFPTINSPCLRALTVLCCAHLLVPTASTHTGPPLSHPWLSQHSSLLGFYSGHTCCVIGFIFIFWLL